MGAIRAPNTKTYSGVGTGAATPVGGPTEGKRGAAATARSSKPGGGWGSDAEEKIKHPTRCGQMGVPIGVPFQGNFPSEKS